MTLHPDYPLPDTDDPVMKPFWEGCRRGELLFQKEKDTGKWHWPPKPSYWKGGKLEWCKASGRGEVYTYVVAHAPFLPALEHLLPHIMVVVELEEGPRLVGYMVGCKPEEMRFGMKVRVAFRELTDDVALPVWEASA
jgi:uncharacterized OB-fold protein